MAVEQDVTCLIGKNESGKTTVLKALHRLNPANAPDSFNETKDYPRRYLSRDRRKAGGTLADVTPINASFTLEDEDCQLLGKAFADVSFPPSTRVTAWRTYGGGLGVDLLVAPENRPDAHEVTGRSPTEVSADRPHVYRQMAHDGLGRWPVRRRSLR